MNKRVRINRLKYHLMDNIFMPTAYILINCILGKEEDIIKQISQIQQVKEVRGTYGVHDMFVKIQTDTVDEMNNTITNSIRKINGITSTVTLVSIPEQGGRG
ncbi:Lrp/AsnC ligand binding domain-containing protein [Candidatus Nitrosocosmicus sp. FF01]|uniref:Lrp/AsnC ligand binding domain-containing protein n=1 Tax=Candidatus Nitrosocosmicus sp. FF01 TaxID=3397670 RepID=UPI0039E96917